jgi:predicted nucleotidyltransferase
VDKAEFYCRAKHALEGAFGERLCQVIHYGSTARGDSDTLSDIDLLVVLEGPVQLGRDLDVIVKNLYALQLEVDNPIHAVPVDIADYEAGEFGVYRAAKREGVVL